MAIHIAFTGKGLAPAKLSGFRDFALDWENAEGKSAIRAASQAQPAWGLNRYLSLPKRLILASRVESGMTSLVPLLSASISDHDCAHPFVRQE